MTFIVLHERSAGAVLCVNVSQIVTFTTDERADGSLVTTTAPDEKGKGCQLAVAESVDEIRAILRKSGDHIYE